MCSARIFKPASPLFDFSCSFHFTNAVSPVVSSFRCMDCPGAPAHGLDCRTPIASIRSSIRSRSTSQNFSAERRSRSRASTSAASSRSLGWRCDGRERLFDFRSLRLDFDLRHLMPVARAAPIIYGNDGAGFPKSCNGRHSGEFKGKLATDPCQRTTSGLKSVTRDLPSIESCACARLLTVR